MAGLYDLMLLIDPNAPDERREAVIAEVESLIQSGGGQIVGNYDWGQRRMTFEIDHRPEAEYRLYQFQGDRELLERLRHAAQDHSTACCASASSRSKPGQPTRRRRISRAPGAGRSATRGHPRGRPRRRGRAAARSSARTPAVIPSGYGETMDGSRPDVG